jgi:hypothetical protein
MGWVSPNSKSDANRRSVEVTRFDPWANRPDHPKARQRWSSYPRSSLAWLAVFAVLVVGYMIREELAVTAWRIFEHLFPG